MRAAGDGRRTETFPREVRQAKPGGGENLKKG